MDQRDPQLKFDYIAQAANMLSNQERIFLDATEDEGLKPLGGIQRLIFLFKRLARAVGHRNVFAFFERVESFLSFCEANYASLAAKDKEVFIELYDHLSLCFDRLQDDPDEDLAHESLFYAFEQVQKSVDIKNRALSFSLGAKEKPSFDKERLEIQQLAQDLDVLQRGAGGGQLASVSLKHLRSISQRLLELGKVINLNKMSDLYNEIGKDFRRKNYRFGFYGGEHMVDRRALSALRPVIHEVLENAYFSSKDERSEAFFKTSAASSGSASKTGNARLEIQLAMADVKAGVLENMELALESMGFQVLCHRDEFSGTGISIDIPRAINSIEGQVVRLDGQSYAIDMRYIDECVKLGQDNIIDIKRKAVYLNHKGSCIPTLDLRTSLGLEKRPLEGKFALILEMRGDRAALIVDSVGRRQSLSLRSLNEELPAHRYFKSVCFLESSLPVFLLDGKKIIQDQKTNEMGLKKFLEVSADEIAFAIDSKDIRELAPYEKLTVVPNPGAPCFAMMNYQGEPIMIHSLFEKLGLQNSPELRNIVICRKGAREEDGYFGLAVGERISIRTISVEDCYEKPAMACSAPSSLCKGAYLQGERETAVLDVSKVRAYRRDDLRLKKVA